MHTGLPPGGSFPELQSEAAVLRSDGEARNLRIKTRSNEAQCSTPQPQSVVREEFPSR
jgi:hypothetical protein